jgi:hypothetical protein
LRRPMLSAISRHPQDSLFLAAADGARTNP